MNRRLARALPVLVAVIPAVLLCGGVARYILNHFFAHAPYLLDSGLLSDISYRSGPLLRTTNIACSYATSFYQVYFSPIIGVFSGLSYLVPVGRIEWFAFVQAMVYLPVAVAVYLAASRFDPASATRRLPITLIAALAFAFSGLVLWTVGYPHYEIATSGLVCLVLAAVVTGRTKLAWVCLGLAASVRQDGGGHVALALLPLIYLHWRGVAMSPSRRRLWAVFGVAIGASVLAVVLQRLLVTPVDRLRDVYIGTPAYAHLSWDLLAERARTFLASSQVIYYPFVATAVIAILRRDTRYVLGWAATVPWFLFNFTAHDSQKSQFQAYTVGPFIVAVFWVYLYGAFLAPSTRRLHAGVVELLFALVCIASLLGGVRSAPGALHYIVDEMRHARPGDRAAVHGFVDIIEGQRARLGKLAVDSAVAALAITGLTTDDSWHLAVTADTIAFHTETNAVAREMPSSLAANKLDVCTHVLRTGLYLCTRDRPPADLYAGVPSEVIPAVFAYSYVHARGLTVDGRGIEISPDHSLGMWLGALSAGTYLLTIEFEGRGDARLEVTGDDLGIAPVDVPSGTHTLQFTVDGRQIVDFAIYARTAAVKITAAQLRSR